MTSERRNSKSGLSTSPSVIGAAILVLIGVVGASTAYVQFFYLPGLGCTTVEEGTIEFEVFQWGYNVTNVEGPIEWNRTEHGDHITIPVCTRVTFQLDILESTKEAGYDRHGFMIVGTEVSEILDVGSRPETTHLFDEAQTYEYACAIYCGTGHPDMNGEIVITA